jgi:hypothetical protein
MSEIFFCSILPPAQIFKKRFHDDRSLEIKNPSPDLSGKGLAATMRPSTCTTP